MSIKKRVENKNHDLVFWLLALSTLVLGIVVVGNLSKKTVQVVNSDSAARVQTEIVPPENQLTNPQDNAPKNQDNLSNIPGIDCFTSHPGPAETYVSYLDKKTSVSLVLPYSFSWGTERCPVLQTVLYDEDPGGIADSMGLRSWLRFGPAYKIYNGDGAFYVPDGLSVTNTHTFLVDDASRYSAERGTELSIFSPTSSEAVYQQILHGQDFAHYPKGKILQRTINGMRVYSISSSDGNTWNIWYAVGRSYGYLLSSRDWLTDAEAIKIIESIKVK